MSFFPCLGGPDQEPDEEGYYLACEFTDIEENGVARIKINRKAVAVFKVKTDRTRVFAMANSCVHAGTPLDTGVVEDVDGRLCVRCPGHGIQYDLKTGVSLQEGGSYRQKVYKVKKKGKEIWVHF